MRNLRLGYYATNCCNNARPLAEFVREQLACGVRCREFVQQEKTRRDDEVCRTRMQIARTIAVGINTADRTGTISDATIPVAAISVRPING